MSSKEVLLSYARDALSRGDYHAVRAAMVDLENLTHFEAGLAEGLKTQSLVNMINDRLRTPKEYLA